MINAFKSRVNSDIYVGLECGKKVMQEIEHAKSSVTVVSPYLSPDYVDKLIELHKRGIQIKLVTTDEIEDYRSTKKVSILKKLIRKNSKDNRRYQRKKIAYQLSIYILIACIIAILGSMLYFRLHWEIWRTSIYIGTLFIFTLFILIGILYRKKKSLRLFISNKGMLFPIKIMASPYSPEGRSYKTATKKKKFFVHSKVYIIDNKIAYVGSLNFTKGGFIHNFESRCQFSDLNLIKQLNEMVDDLFEDDSNMTITLNRLIHQDRSIQRGFTWSK